MSKMNYCVGCYFNGTVDGYMPECTNCCAKIAALTETNKNEMCADELFADDANADISQPVVAKNVRRNQRRIAAKKFNRKAPQTLAIVTAKSNRTQGVDEKEIARSKFTNVSKNATFAYKTSVSLEFPEISVSQRRFPYLKNHDLISQLKSWKEADNASNEMKTACNTAINVLDKAEKCGGAIVGLHRSKNTLHLTIGFREKISLLDFRQKTA